MKFHNKSCPLNEIPVLIYKQISDRLSKLLCFYFNKSIETGHFPSLLKISGIKPLSKKGDVSSKTNYRPISILPFTSKVLEKLMYSN